MGNCATKNAAHDLPEAVRREAQIEKRHRQRRSSLGRFAEFLTHQSSVIQDAVSAELPLAAHRGSQEVISLVEGPGYLDPAVWCAGLDVPIVKARATALEKAADTLLTPLLNNMEDALGGRAAAAGKGVSTGWHTAGLKEFTLLLPGAAKQGSGVGLMSLSHAMNSILTVVHALSRSAIDAELPILPEIYHVWSLNRLMDMVGTLATRNVAAETRAVGQQRWQGWEQVCAALHLEEEQLLVALGPHAKALLLWMQGGVGGRQAVSFQVRRGSVFQDAFLQTRCSELLQATTGGCVVEAAFSDVLGASPMATEAGSWGHGPRKEFFLLAGQGMVDGCDGLWSTGEQRAASPDSPAPLFLYNRWAARYWFNGRIKPSVEVREQYTFAGWLLGQALANRASLGIPFPELLFSKLLQGPSFKATVEVLQEFDVEAAAAVRGAAALKEADWRELLRQEGLDPAMKRRAYIKHAVHRLLVHDIHWQFTAFAQGFFTAVDFKSILRWSMTPTDLEEWACSSFPADSPREDPPLQQSYRVLLDPAMQAQSPLLGPTVIRIVDAWSPEMRSAFLKFVTGVGRPCLPQMETIRISMPFVEREGHPQDLPRLLHMLPQAHTCGNTLEVPDYWAALAASDAVARALMEGPAVAGPLDLEGRLERLVEARLRVAVLHACTYEVEGGPSLGLSDLPTNRQERAAAAGSKIPIRLGTSSTDVSASSTPRSQQSRPTTPTAVHREAPSRIPKLAVAEAAKLGQGGGQHLLKVASRHVRRGSHGNENKLGRPQQSSSPLSPEESIPAIRGDKRS